MRAFFFAALAMLGACASGASEPDLPPDPASPFPVERGAALPPPAQNASGSTAPPEGRAGGGIDFGQWRQADPAAYAPAFQTQIRQRYAGRDASAIRADLEANGFACENAQRLDCRIEIMERQCAFDWYVVLERNRSEPVAGFDQMCLGAR
ncbi:MAG: hypothetical protein AB7Q23_15610 [Hyphomonadaceae bacterium]